MPVGSMEPLAMDSTMTWTHNETHPLAEEAARWLIELEEPGPKTLRDFGAWLRASPRHVEEFLLVSAVWKEFEGFDAERRMQIQQLIQEAGENVTRLATEAVHPPTRGAASLPSRHRTWAVAVASVFACAAFWFFAATSAEVYVTSRGEQRAFKLNDGSIVYLNTQSRVEVQFSRKARSVRLLEGEAMFSVEHDPARPFRVISDDTVIQAVGTRFNVYRSQAGTTVSVVEGIVEISPTRLEPQPPRSQSTIPATVAPNRPAIAQVKRLGAGEQARVSHDGEIVKRDLPDLGQIVAWRDRTLVFRGDSLADVAREFNRYNELQVRLEGGLVRSKRLTGVFDADDPRSLILFLSRDPSLQITQEGSREVIVRQRQRVEERDITIRHDAGYRIE
jgi:transmembrane sensor